MWQPAPVIDERSVWTSTRVFTKVEGLLMLGQQGGMRRHHAAPPPPVNEKNGAVKDLVWYVPIGRKIGIQ